MRTGVDAPGSVETRVPLCGRLLRSALVVHPDRVGLVFPPYWGTAEGPSFPTRRLGVVDLRTDAATRLTSELWDESGLKLPTFGAARPTLLLLFAEPCRVPPLRRRTRALWPNPTLRRREAASAAGLWIDGLLLAVRHTDPLVRALHDAGAEQVTDPDAWLDRRRPQRQDLAGLERPRRATQREPAPSRGARGAACGILGALLVATIWGLVAGFMGDGFREGVEGTPADFLALVAGLAIGWFVGRGARRTNRPLIVLAGVLALTALAAGEVFSFVVAEWRVTGTLLHPAVAVDLMAARFRPGPGLGSSMVVNLIHPVFAGLLAAGIASLYRQQAQGPA
jgi:hypothetical protein